MAVVTRSPVMLSLQSLTISAGANEQLQVVPAERSGVGKERRKGGRKEGSLLPKELMNPPAFLRLRSGWRRARPCWFIKVDVVRAVISALGGLVQLSALGLW